MSEHPQMPGDRNLRNELRKFLQQIENDSPGITSADTDQTDAAEAEYKCDKCGNWRWLAEEGRGGTLVACECQTIVWGASPQKRLKHYSLLPENYHRSFADTLPDGRPSSVDPISFRAAFDASRAFADNPRGWLVLKGPAGTGKTHLARAIVSKCIEAGVPIRFESVLQLMDDLRRRLAAREEDGPSYADRLEQTVSAPVLVLDNITDAKTDWSIDRIEKIVEDRSNLKLPTVVTWDTDITFNSERLERRLSDRYLVKQCSLHSSIASSMHTRDLSVQMLKRMTFESFQTKGRGRNSKAAIELLTRAKSIALEFTEAPENWLYLNGPTGVGKTHLAVAIAGKRLYSGKELSFYTFTNLMDALRQGYDSGRNSVVSFYDLLKHVTSSPLLILDDLGAASITSWTAEKLYQIISQRHNHRLPTVITSRGTLEEGAPTIKLRAMLANNSSSGYEEAIWSRLLDDSLVTDLYMDANDYRSSTKRSIQ